MAGLPATQVAMTNYHISDYASLSPVERAKRDAAYRAVKDHFDPAFHYVGIGSGSTVVYVVEAIAQLGHAVTGSIIFVPTGFQSRELIVEAGLPLGSIDSVVPTAASQLRMGEGAIKVATGQQDLGLKGERLMLDVVFDGADEVDDDLNCIKGGGACLFQEKLVATSARKFVCVADYRKYQGRLLKKWPTIPIEIVPTAAPVVVRNLRLMGSPRPFLRLGGSAKAGPIVTDNGNFIVDAPFAPLLTRHDAEKQGGITEADAGKDGVWQVETLARRIKDLVGVVEVGLFTGKNGVDAALAWEIGGGQKPVAAYFGMEGGAVKILTPEGLADAK